MNDGWLMEEELRGKERVMIDKNINKTALRIKNYLLRIDMQAVFQNACHAMFLLF